MPRGMVPEIMNEAKERLKNLNKKKELEQRDGYLFKLLKEDILYNGLCVLTNKRVYFRGRYFQKAGKGYRSDRGEYMVELKDVTGFGFSTARFGILFFLGIVFVIVMSVLTALFLRLVEVVDHLYFGNEAIIHSCLAFLVLGLIAVPICYYLKPFKIFAIDYPGGGIAFLVFDFLEEDAKVFQKALYNAKEALTMGEDESAPKEGMAPAPCQEQDSSDSLKIAESGE